MKIELGKHVITRDGVKVGTIDRLVVDPRHQTLLEIIVHKGVLLHHDRIIEPWIVDHVDGDGTVRLRVTGEQAEKLPLFVEEEYIKPVQDERYPAAAGLFTVLWPARYERAHYGQYGDDMGFFGPAPFDPPEVEARTNVPANGIAVRRRVDVVGSDGSKLGLMTSVSVDADGELTGITVRVGHLGNHREIEFPATMIASATHNRITLAAPAATVDRGPS